MKRWYRLLLWVVFNLGLAGHRVVAGEAAPETGSRVRLYVFDSGRIRILDPTVFGFRREEVLTADMVAACYLVVHPKGTLMWDAGVIPDADIKAGIRELATKVYVATVERTLESQLASVGHRPGNITYFALSHYHADHSANANAFAGATWLVQQREYDAMFSERIPEAQRRRYAALRDSRKELLEGEHDVFGDGRVVIKPAYGHTAGHQVLYVKLEHTGPVVLAGDLYHYPEERSSSRLPPRAFDKELLQASRHSIEEFVRTSGAQLWIEHDLENFKNLKKSPSFYD